MIPYPRHLHRITMDLNDAWDFTFLGATDPRAVNIPGIAYDDTMLVPMAFDATPQYTAQRGTAVYRKRLVIPANTRSRLRFGAVALWCAVYIDGKKACEHADGYEEFWVDLPASAQEQREIVLVVDNQFDSERTPVQQEYYDWYQHGGVLRPVYLYLLPALHIDEVYVHPEDIYRGKVRVEIVLNGTVPEELPVTLDVDGEALYIGHARPGADHHVTLPLAIPQPHLWNCEDPHLYTLTVRAGEDDYITRFGLREISAHGAEIRLNGESIKLVGFGRHELHPQFGAALPDEQIMQDIQILRDLGCNFVRGCHYPQDQRFLDLCDETGILVWEESTGWNNRSPDYTNDAFVAAQLSGAENMIRKSYNHPSVILWGFLNEGFNPPRSPEAPAVYHKIVDRIRALDPHRLISNANTYYPETCDQMPRIDVVSYNMYPGWYYYEIDENGIEQEIREWVRKVPEMTGEQRPFMISEIGAGAIPGWRDWHEDRWTEQYQARLLDRACEEAVTNPGVTGIAIWTFQDFRSTGHMESEHAHAMRRPRLYNNKGVVDEYRRSKPSYDVVRKWFRKARGLDG